MLAYDNVLAGISSDLYIGGAWRPASDGARLEVIDPLAPPADLDALAAERTVTVLVTSGWHRRDADAFAERFSAASLKRALNESSVMSAWIARYCGIAW